MRRIRLATRNRRPVPRRGAALVEGAVVAIVMLLILLSMLDLSLAVLHYNSLSGAARRLAREAVIHGEMAPPAMTSWGPATYSGSADDETDFSSAARPALAAMNPRDVNLRLEWPDGGNDVDQRVRATVSCVYEPIVPFLFGSDGYELTAVSTMRIMH